MCRGACARANTHTHTHAHTHTHTHTLPFPKSFKFNSGLYPTFTKMFLILQDTDTEQSISQESTWADYLP